MTAHGTEVIQDLPYVNDALPEQCLDIYIPAQAGTSSPLIVYVHGGAWRSGSRKWHIQLAHNLADTTSCAVAVVDYRLSPRSPDDGPEVHHPAHAQDVLSALTFLHETKSLPHYDPAHIRVIGHSCGTHILAAIFLDSSHLTPSLTPSPSLLKAIDAFVLVEGIYDLDLFLKSFPLDFYQQFVKAAFGPSYSRYSVTNLPLRDGNAKTQWMIIHSTGDTLVDVAQASAMWRHLSSKVQSPDLLHKDWHTLKLNHDELLDSVAFTNVVSRFINSI